MTSIEQVEQFHRAFGVPVKDDPDIDDQDINELRVRLLQEELDELTCALAEGDPGGTLDALTDLQYVLDGTYLSLGFSKVKDAAFAEVHRSNMSKLDLDGKPIRRADGKVMKGALYFPPNLDPFVV